MNDVEARLAGGKLDYHLLALLLFRRCFGIDLDAGQFLEFAQIFDQRFAARAFDQVDFKRGAGVFFPVHRRRCGADAEHRAATDRCRACQKGATRGVEQ
ncbi:hypothetical protein D3C80_1879350 [compost metagenome]